MLFIKIFEKSEQRYEANLADAKEFLKSQHDKEVEAITKRHEIEINEQKSKVNTFWIVARD